MARFKKIKAITEDGWSDWQAPVQGYRLACCDCGLSHNVEFKILKAGKTNSKGFWGAEELPWGEYRILMRAKRNNRSTGQLRRHDKNSPHP